MLTALNGSAGLANTKGDDWPKSAKALGNKLTRLDSALRLAGIEVGPPMKSHGKRVRTIRGTSSENGSAPEAPPNGAES